MSPAVVPALCTLAVVVVTVTAALAAQVAQGAVAGGLAHHTLVAAALWCRLSVNHSWCPICTFPSLPNMLLGAGLLLLGKNFHSVSPSQLALRAGAPLPTP